MTHCFLIRHAHAGKRGAVDDDQRGLSARGQRQSQAIADRLGGDGIGTIMTSPFVRCVETIEPLAASIGLTAECDDGLAEGAGPLRALALIEHAEHPLALCSHGDVIGETMNVLSRRGVDLADDRVAKGSVWVLTVEAGTVVAAEYLTPGPA